MDVVLTDTFAKSLKRLRNRQRWFWKAWDCLRYDVPRFLKNLKTYSKDLWNTYPWDTHGALRLLRTNIRITADTIEKYGHEVDESRLKKIEKMRRAVDILNYHIEDDFIDLAEEQLGKTVSDWVDFAKDDKHPDWVKLVSKATEQEEKDNSAIYALARKLENDTWKELFEILHGQNVEEYRKLMENLTEEEKKSEDHWYKWFDGSGMKGWWD
jgi:hypothetical protein